VCYVQFPVNIVGKISVNLYLSVQKFMISLMYSEYHNDRYSEGEKIQTRNERTIIIYSKDEQTRRKKDIR
jgi:hypothetical protein